MVQSPLAVPPRRSRRSAPGRSDLTAVTRGVPANGRKRFSDAPSAAGRDTPHCSAQSLVNGQPPQRWQTARPACATSPPLLLLGTNARQSAGSPPPTDPRPPGTTPAPQGPSILSYYRATGRYSIPPPC